MVGNPWSDANGWGARAGRVKREVGIPVTTSWNLGVPQNADAAVRSGDVDVVLLGRPALANPHWPVWAARELGVDSPFDLVPEDWDWWLKNFRGHAPSIGWPAATGEDTTVAGDAVPVPVGATAHRAPRRAAGALSARQRSPEGARSSGATGA